MENRPNILFILTDDQGAWAMRCAGNGDIHTPNLDRLAREGTRFENFFCASPVCSPARASILTGRIPSQHGVHDWIRRGNLDRRDLGAHDSHWYFQDEREPIRYLDGMTTYTDLLAEHGYHCALSGKWHLGDSIHPQHGFTRWYTIGRGGCMYTEADMIDEGKLVFEEGYVTDLITNRALRYLEELSREDAPFYLSVHYTAPHDPWDEDQHPAAFYDLYRDCACTATPDLPIHPRQIGTAPSGVGPERLRLLRGYYTAITAMDAGVGRLLERLEALGLADDTLVIFSGDNGMNMGHHGIWGKGNGTFPFNMYDTAVKVPFLARWPGRIPAGRVAQSLCSQYDLIQTFNDLLGLNASLPENLPGSSFASVLLGGEREDGRVVVFDEYGPSRMIRTRRWKYIHRVPYGPHELYDLEADPEEAHDLAGSPEHAQVEAQLRDALFHWFCRYADPAVDGSREAVTGFGQLSRPGIYSQGQPAYAPDPKHSRTP